MWSAVMSRASASYVRSSRWRRTSGRDVEHVLGDRVRASPQQRDRPRAAHEEQRGSRADTETDRRRQVVEAETFGMAGGLDEVDRVLRHRAIDEDRVGGVLQLLQPLERDHLRRDRRPNRHPVEDLELLRGARVVDEDLHHEPVALSVGELVDALALDRVLGGDDEERLRHEVGDAADRHLLLGHHLEQRRLHLGGRPVDLVGEQEVDEHRAELDVEPLGAPPVDAGADDVGRQQVGRELDARERSADDVGERLGGERLGESGHRLDETVAPRQQADEQPFEQSGLADDDLAQLEEDALDGVGDGFARVFTDPAGTGAGVVGNAGVVGRAGTRRVVPVGKGLGSARHATLTVVRRSAMRESRVRPTDRRLDVDRSVRDGQQ